MQLLQVQPRSHCIVPVVAAAQRAPVSAIVILQAASLSGIFAVI